MKKRFIFSLMCFLLIFTFTACAASSDMGDENMTFFEKLFGKKIIEDELGDVGDDGKKVSLAEGAVLTKVYFSLITTYSTPIDSYEIVNDNGNVAVVVNVEEYVDDEYKITKDSYPISKEEFDKLEQVVMEYTLDDWDGFKKSNHNILDGEGFDFCATFSDGTKVNAHGSNSYPNNYREVWNVINDLVSEFETQSLKAHGFNVD